MTLTLPEPRTVSGTLVGICFDEAYAPEYYRNIDVRATIDGLRLLRVFVDLRNHQVAWTVPESAARLQLTDAAKAKEFADRYCQGSAHRD